MASKALAIGIAFALLSFGFYAYAANGDLCFDNSGCDTGRGEFCDFSGGRGDEGVCVGEAPGLAITVSSSKSTILTTDTNQYVAAVVSDPDNIVKTLKVYIDNSLKKTCDVPSTGVQCKFDFSGADFSIAAHTYYAEAFDVSNVRILRDPTSGTKTFTVIASPGQVIGVRISPVQPASTGTFTLEGYKLPDVSYPNTAHSLNVYINDAENEIVSCTDLSRSCRSSALQGSAWTGKHTYFAILKDSQGNDLKRSPDYSFTITGTSSTGLTASQSSVSVAAGGTAQVTITGGTGTHTATSSATNIATAAVSGTTVTITGIAAGSATITVRDSSATPKTATITVTVTPTTTICDMLSPLPPYTGAYGSAPYSSFGTEKQKAWRISMCFQPPSKLNSNFASVMDEWVAAYNRAFDPDVRRKAGGSPTTDAIDFPADGTVDVIEAAGTSSPKWTYSPAEGSCQLGSFVDRMEGFPQINDCSRTSVKYRAGRVFTNHDPSSGVTTALISALQAAGLHPTRAGDDKINFNDIHEGANVGTVDVIKDYGTSAAKWQWAPIGVSTSIGNVRIDAVTPARVSAGTSITITGSGLKDARGRGVVQFFDARGDSSRTTVVGTVNNEGTRISVAVPSGLRSGQIRVRVYVDETHISNEKTILLLENNPPVSRITAPPADSVHTGNFVVTASDADESGLDKCYYTTGTASSPSPTTPTPAPTPPPVGQCEWAYASYLNANPPEPQYAEGQCVQTLWIGRNINTALGCSNSFTYRGVPAATWRNWANAEVRSLVSTCNTFPDNYAVSTEQLSALRSALQPLMATCPAESKGISCVCNPNPNDPLCGQFVQFIGGIGTGGSSGGTGSTLPAGAKLRTCNSQFTVEAGHGKDCAQQGSCTVSVFAVDTNGNVGQPDSRTFRIKSLFTNITSPADGAFIDKNFSVTVEDRDFATASSPSGAPVIGSFSAEPASAAAGQSVTLSWSVTGAASVTLDGATIPASGTRTVNPAQTTTYTISATNSAGTSTRSVSVVVGGVAPAAQGLTCTYDIYSGTTKTKDGAQRQCNRQFTVTVGSQLDCRDIGERTCRVLSKVRKTVNGVAVEDTSERFYTVDWISPESKIVEAPAGWVSGDFTIRATDDAKGSQITECQYRVVSGGTETVRWTSRPCSTSEPTTITITVGNSSSKDCRHEGGEACKVFVRPLGRARTPGINDSKSIAVIFGETDSNGFASISAVTTHRGINFSGTTRSQLRAATFYVCNSSSSPAACIDAFAAGRSGLGSPNFCGSLSNRCPLRCSDTSVSFYFAARGTEAGAIRPSVVVSPIRSAACPVHNIGQINSYLAQFRELDERISVQIMMVDQFITENGETDTANGETLDILNDALLLVKDHLNFMETTMQDMTTKKSMLIISRSDSVLTQVDALLRGTAPSTHTRLTVNMPLTVRFNRTTQLQFTVSKSGPRPSYASVYCTITRPDSTAIRITTRPTDSGGTRCVQLVEGNSVTLSSQFLPNIIGTWQYSCTLARSARSDCSFEVNMSPTAGRFSALPGFGTFISGISGPTTVMRGQPAVITATVNNSDEVEKFASVRCDFTDSAGLTRRNGSSCISVPANSERQAEVRFIADRTGAWRASGCMVNASEHTGCIGAVIDNVSRVVWNYTAAIPDDVFIESAATPSGNVNNDTSQRIAVLVNNPKTTAAYVRISCRLEPDGASPVIANLAQGIEGSSSRSFDVRFDVNTTGLWNVQNCTAFKSDSPTVPPTNAVHSVGNLGTFTVVASDNLTIASASFANEISNGTSASIEILVRNPSVARYGRVTCAFRDPSNVQTSNSSACTLMPSGTTQAPVRIFLHRAGTWNIDSCSVSGSVNSDCSDSRLHSSRSSLGSFVSTSGIATIETFTDTSTSVRIQSVMLPDDVINNSDANIDVLAGNPLNDDRFALVSCSVRDPNGISRVYTSLCEGIRARSTNTFTPVVPVNIVGRWNVTACTLNMSTSCSTAVLNDTKTVNSFFTAVRGINVSFSSFTLPADSQPGLATVRASLRNPSDAARFARVTCSFRTPANEIVSNSTACTQIGGTAVQNYDVNIDAGAAGTWRVDTCSIRASLSGCNDLHDTRSNVGTFNITAFPSVRLAELFVQNISAPISATNNSQINAIVAVRNPNAANSSYALAGCTFADPLGSPARQTSPCAQITANSTQQFAVPFTLGKAGTWTVRDCFVNASSNNCVSSALHNVSAETRAISVTLPPDLYITSVAAQDEAVNNSDVPVDVFVSNPLNDDRYGSVSCLIEDPAGGTQSRAAGCSPVTRQSSKRFNLSVFANRVGTWNVRNCTVSASASSSCSPSSASASLINGDVFNVIRGYNLTLSNIAITSPAFVSTKIDVAYTLRNPSASERFGRVTCTFSRGNIVNRSSCFTIPAESFVDSKATITTDIAGAWSVTCNAERSLDSTCASAEVHDSETRSFEVVNPPDLFIQSVEMPELAPKDLLSVATLRVRNPPLTKFFGFAGCTFKNRLNETFRNVSECRELSEDTNFVTVGVIPELRGNWSVSGCFVNASRSEGCGGNRTHNVSTASKSFFVSAPLLTIDDVYLTSENLFVGDLADIAVNVRNIGERAYTAFVNCTIINPNNVQHKLTTLNQTIPLGETRAFHPQFVVDAAGRWRVDACSVYRIGSVILEDTKTANQQFDVQPASGTAAECSTATPCEFGECIEGRCVQQTCGASNCPGIKSACYCSSNQCVACGDGYTCSSGRCAPEIQVSVCRSNSECPPDNACINSVCQPRPAECFANSDCASGACSNGRCVTPSKPLFDRDMTALLIIVLAVIMVPLILFIYIKRSL